MLMTKVCVTDGDEVADSVGEVVDVTVEKIGVEEADDVNVADGVTDGEFDDVTEELNVIVEVLEADLVVVGVIVCEDVDVPDNDGVCVDVDVGVGVIVLDDVGV